jgi:hypothetical protein
MSTKFTRLRLWGGLLNQIPRDSLSKHKIRGISQKPRHGLLGRGQHRGRMKNWVASNLSLIRLHYGMNKQLTNRLLISHPKSPPIKSKSSCRVSRLSRVGYLPAQEYQQIWLLGRVSQLRTPPSTLPSHLNTPTWINRLPTFKAWVETYSISSRRRPLRTLSAPPQA